MSDLTILISNHWQVLEQIALLQRDISINRWDAGAVVMVNNGTLDIRGLGEVTKPAQASGILFAAFKSLPPASQADMLSELSALMQRSALIEAEAQHIKSFRAAE
jgi:hypothetical protein